MSDPKCYPYTTHLNVLFEPLQLIDVQALADACKDRWYNQTLAKVNESILRLGVLEGEYHWHRHDREDELFFVLEGKLLVDLKERTFELGPRQGVTVPHGVVHRTRAPIRTVVLMIEPAGVVPTGD
jgi:mannose-6-phosphate isomerase-like protein (cupin superfamily)